MGETKVVICILLLTLPVSQWYLIYVRYPFIKHIHPQSESQVIRTLLHMLYSANIYHPAYRWKSQKSPIRTYMISEEGQTCDKEDRMTDMMLGQPENSQIMGENESN